MSKRLWLDFWRYNDRFYKEIRDRVEMSLNDRMSGMVNNRSDAVASALYSLIRNEVS